MQGVSKLDEVCGLIMCFLVVINGIYHFHASSSTFAEFWNDTFWSSQETQSRKISQRQIWHTFVQESMRMVAKSSGVTVEMENDIPMAQVTKNAFILETTESSSVLKTILVLNALINTKKLQIESQVMTLLLYLVLMKIIKCLLL